MSVLKNGHLVLSNVRIMSLSKETEIPHLPPPPPSSPTPPLPPSFNRPRHTLHTTLSPPGVGWILHGRDLLQCVNASSPLVTNRPTPETRSPRLRGGRRTRGGGATQSMNVGTDCGNSRLTFWGFHLFQNWHMYNHRSNF